MHEMGFRVPCPSTNELSKTLTRYSTLDVIELLFFVPTCSKFRHICWLVIEELRITEDNKGALQNIEYLQNIEMYIFVFLI